MTKKHFIELANSIRAIEPINLKQKDSRATAEHRQWELMIDMLAQFCQNQNSRFNESRWRAYIAGACGPSGGRV